MNYFSAVCFNVSEFFCVFFFFLGGGGGGYVLNDRHVTYLKLLSFRHLSERRILLGVYFK